MPDKFLACHHCPKALSKAMLCNGRVVSMQCQVSMLILSDTSDFKAHLNHSIFLANIIIYYTAFTLNIRTS